MGSEGLEPSLLRIKSPMCYQLHYEPIRPVRVELTIPFGHQVLSLTRIPFPPRTAIRAAGFEPAGSRF